MVEWKEDYDHWGRSRSADCLDTSVELADWDPATRRVHRWPLGVRRKHPEALGPAPALALA